MFIKDLKVAIHYIELKDTFLVLIKGICGLLWIVDSVE